MNQVAAASSDEGDAHVQVNSTTDTLRNQSQIGCLTTLLNSLGSYLCQSARTEMMEPEHDESDLKARKEASETFQSVNLQIRNVLDDQSRWSMRKEKVEKDLANLIHAQTKESKTRVRELEQRIEQTKGGRPCLQFKANCLQLANGSWIVWLGPSLVEASLYATGKTPLEAMDNFDIAFKEGRPLPDALRPAKAAPPSTAPTTPLKKITLKKK